MNTNSEPVKLNLGCGHDLRKGHINIDRTKEHGADIATDFESPACLQMFDTDSVDYIHAAHLLEHLHNILPFMQECWRVAKPNAVMEIWVPYGSSDDADEDPTHVRRFFLNSCEYFGQPIYTRADYGYRGDWEVVLTRLFLTKGYEKASEEEIQSMILMARNIIEVMQVVMKAVKPCRKPGDPRIVTPVLNIVRPPSESSEASEDLLSSFQQNH